MSNYYHVCVGWSSIFRERFTMTAISDILMERMTQGDGIILALDTNDPLNDQANDFMIMVVNTGLVDAVANPSRRKSPVKLH